MIPTEEKVDNRIEIPSDIRNIKKASNEILGHLQRLKIDKSIQFDIRLAVEEAVRNSIVHGNRYDKELPVTVSYAIDKDKLEVEIKDRGNGFDVKKIPDPRSKDYIMKEGGRGIFLMYRLMDKVEYNRRGNKVKMTKFFK